MNATPPAKPDSLPLTGVVFSVAKYLIERSRRLGSRSASIFTSPPGTWRPARVSSRIAAFREDRREVDGTYVFEGDVVRFQQVVVNGQFAINIED